MTVTGMVLVAFGCAWAGFRAAEQLRSYVQRLDQVIVGLRLMEQELELDSPDLTKLMERLERRSDGAAKRIFSCCKMELSRRDQVSFRQIWKHAIEEQGLKQEVISALDPLADTLGRCDCSAQCRMVAAVCRQLERIRVLAESEYRQQGKVYRIIGMSGGAFLIVLLL